MRHLADLHAGLPVTRPNWNLLSPRSNQLRREHANDVVHGANADACIPPHCSVHRIVGEPCAVDVVVGGDGHGADRVRRIDVESAPT